MLRQIDIEKLNASMAKAGEAALKAFENIVRHINNIKSIGRLYGALLKKMEERKRQRQRHKLDLTRAKVQHQVFCRKPRHLVKKII